MTQALRLVLIGLVALMLVAFGMAVFLTTTARAEVRCGPWQKVLDLAGTKYGEKPAFVATDEDGLPMIVAVDPKDGSWGLFAQPNPETMCFIAGGEGWTAAPKEVIERPTGEPT